MILVSQKRVLMSMALALLCTPDVPVKAQDNYAGNTMLIGCAIGAGIIGLCGLIYGITQAYKKKSPDQIADDAEKVFHTAHMRGQCFYTEYMNVFEQARFGSDLDYVECNFLEAVVRRAQEPHVHVDVEEHISAVYRSLNELEKALEEVKGAVAKFRSRNKTHQLMYDRLVGIMRSIEAERAYLNAYYQRFADHRAYFILSQFESKLITRYHYEFTHMPKDSTESYQSEKQLLHIAKMHNGQSDYPLVAYHVQLCNDITTLECYIRNLKYRYAKREPVHHMFSYLVHIRDVIADTPVFKEERERKKEDDARREMLALRRREVEAQTAMAQAAAQQAQAMTLQAAAAQQQAWAVQRQIYLRQQPTVVVVSNK